MLGSRNRESYLVQWGKTILPRQFFYFPKAKKSFVSPAAAFNPTAALTGQAWQTTTSPSSTPKPKNIILTRDIFFDGLNQDEWLAIMHWLKNRGFMIYLCVKEGEDTRFVHYQSEIQNKIDYYQSLHQLTEFNEDIDFEKLANEFHLPREQVVILNNSNALCLMTSLNWKTRHTFTTDVYESNYYKLFRPTIFANIQDNSKLENTELSNDEINALSIEDFKSLLHHMKKYKNQASILLKKYYYLIQNDYDLLDCFIQCRQEANFILDLLKTQHINVTSFTNLNTLLFGANVSVEKKIELIKNNSHLIKSFSDVRRCYAYSSVEILGYFSSLITNVEELAFAIEQYPFPTKLLEEHWNLVKEGPIISIFLKKCPEKMEELLTLYARKIKPSSELDSYKKLPLAKLLKGCPQKGPEFLEKYGYTIQTARDLRYCMIAYPDGARNLFLLHLDKLDDQIIARDFSQWIAEYFIYHEDKLTSGYLLAACLKHFPNERRRLIESHKNKIHNIYELSACCSVLEVREAKYLIEAHFNFITNIIKLERLIEKNRHLAGWLIQRFHYLIDKDDNSIELLISSCPEHIDWLRSRSENPAKHYFGAQKQTRIDRIYGLTVPSNVSGLSLPNAVSIQPVIEDDKTYLYLGSLDIYHLIKFIKKDYFKELVVIEISHCAGRSILKEFFEAIQIHCPHLKRMLLPIELKDWASSLPYNIEYHESYRELTESKKNEKNRIEKKSIQSNNGKVFLALGNRDKNLNNKTSFNPEFTMISPGELLNYKNKTLQGIRTGIVELSDDLNESHYVDPILTTISTPPLLDTGYINECKKSSDQVNYYLFNINLPANICVRLLSIDAQEKLLGFKGIDANKIQFFRGHDGFYYAKASEFCQLSYIIVAPTYEIQKENYKKISDQDPIKTIIRDYKKSDKYQEIAIKIESLPPIVDGNKHEWLKKLYEERAGVCIHRAYAVWYKIFENEALRNRVRILYIDNNHVQLEMLYEGIWHQVDLGGGNANNIYDPKQTFFNPTYPTNTSLTETVDRHFVKAETAALLHQYITPVPLYTEQQLMENVLEGNSPTTLIITKDVETQANLLLKHARLLKQPLFYLDKPKSETRAQIDLQSGKPSIILFDQMDLFLEAIKNVPAAKLVINWEAFDAQERVALNTAIDDRQKSLYGRSFPDHLQVISLCKEFPNDKSFLSRHKKIFIGHIKQREAEQPKRTYTKVIDVQGFPDWQAFLFGPIVLMDNQLVWQKGPLVELLEAAKENKESLAIEIKNLPCDTQAFTSLLKQAEARGEFNYYGYAISLPEKVTIYSCNNSFDFKSFEAVSIRENTKADEISSNCHHINTILFDYLLLNKKISDGKYQQTPGLIMEAKNKSLALFITSSLSQSQWYCLLTQAKIYNVTLQLYLAKGVELPEELATVPLKADKQKEIVLDFSSIYISNHPFAVVKKLINENTLCLAIEDYNYQDLVNAIHFQYDKQNNHFHNFTEQRSDLISALERGKSVILYGEFTPELLQALQPLLVKHKQLTLVIEDKNLTNDDLKNEYPLLKWLPKHAYQFDLQKQENNIKQPIPFFIEDEVDLDAPIDLANSEEEAQKFITKRCDTILQALSQHNMAQLHGETGVGKSYLIEELKKNYAETITIYNELNDFEKWAKDNSDKQKILFIDEANILDKHLTLFAPLKTDSHPFILYKGIFYQLTPNHKVVFARNPYSYGGGRNEQKLFADDYIPVMQLKNMPPAFIYERVLKPVFATLPQRVKSKIPEALFKEDAVNYLNLYEQRKKQADASLTVRTLQEWVLKYAARQRTHRSLFNSRKKLESSHFVPTPSTLSLRLALNDFIRIRQQQHIHSLPGGMGLNGFLIEGLPGIGKSELVRHSLERLGYKAYSPSEKNSHYYYKLDASLSLAEKEEILIQAFHEGKPVWLDEVNSCLNDGLEKIMTSLLSGMDPTTKEPAKQSGFMLLVTANSMGMEGRSLIGPALRGRLVQSIMPEPTVHDFEAIIRHHLSSAQLKNTNIHCMTSDVHALFKQNPGFNLRYFASLYDDMAHQYPFDNKTLFQELTPAITEEDTQSAAVMTKYHR